MWICLNDAFFSVVDKAKDPDHLMVRARRRGDIERYWPNAKVRRTPGVDYLFRAEIPRADVADRLASEVRSVGYTNFKSSVVDGRLHDAYMGVWSAMSRLQPVAPYASRRGGSSFDLFAPRCYSQKKGGY